MKLKERKLKHGKDLVKEFNKKFTDWASFIAEMPFMKPHSINVQPNMM